MNAGHTLLLRIIGFGQILGILLVVFFAQQPAGNVQVLVDTQGKPAWLYTPSDKPDPDKTYLLVVGLHGLGEDGNGASACAKLAQEYSDVLVLGPSFHTCKPGELIGNNEMYQYSGEVHEQKLAALIREIERNWKLHPKVVLHGFSAGAQFAHRFTMHHPELVAAVSAHSAGRWATLYGDERINDQIQLACKEIPFAISCGENDTEYASPDAPLTRIDGACLFAASMKMLGMKIEFRTWPDLAHERTPEQYEMTKKLVAAARSDLAPTASAAETSDAERIDAEKINADTVY